MAIDRIPGVGPQNSDIAAAVAAPSAATIAAAVAAPSAATIAAAVAAPSAATIASTVAGSVPTLAQINTSVANNASQFGGNWINGATSNAPGTTNSHTISGLSSYKYLKIYFRYSMNAVYTPFFRFNGDSGNNYLYIAQTTLSGNTGAQFSIGQSVGAGFYPGFAGNYQFTINSTMTGSITIDNSGSGAYKQIRIQSVNGPMFYIDGTYISTSAISSMTLGSNESANVSGNFYIIGGN